MDAWLMEQLLALHLAEPVLKAEAARRFAEARSLKVRSIDNIEARWKKAETDNDLPGLRACYVTLLDDLHWAYGKRRLDRRVRRETAKKLVGIAVGLSVASIIPYIFVPGLDWSLLKFLGQYDKNAFHLYGLYTACSFGLLGALFSHMISFRSDFASFDYDQGIGVYDSRVLWIRLLFGMIGSIVLFYAIFGKLIGGELFPDVSNLNPTPNTWPGTNEAKLIVWSFIGGFSEKLIPDFLQRSEASAASADRPNS